jgi:uncharacterized protein YcfJ
VIACGARNLFEETSMIASPFRTALAVTGIFIAAQANAQITFYEREGFDGRSFSTEEQIIDFRHSGYNDRLSSAVVARDRWELCEMAGFGGRCVVLGPGRYRSLALLGLNNRVSSARVIDANGRYDDRGDRDDGHDFAQITLYEREGFRGRSFSTEKKMRRFKRGRFNDHASSVIVQGGRWEICEDLRYSGHCIVLRPGRYPSLAAMNLNNRVSSVRPVGLNTHVDDDRYAPLPAASRDYRRRDDEHLYEADVISVRAVVGTPEQRCWVEREEVVQNGNEANIPGAIAGALIGGILGHQVGGGSGKDLATAGGVVAGALVGANVGRDGGSQQVRAQDVQRCEDIPGRARPEYWDVTYVFRGQEHRVQMTAPPGRRVTVNAYGEPRE